MNPALLKLLRLQGRAVVRRMFRGAKTKRGAMFLLIGGIMFVTWFAGTMSSALLIQRVDVERVRTYFPLAMLAMCITTLVTSAGERAVAFTPAEVDFLFPGPFSRRQLLGYKIARSGFSALFTATLFSIIFLRYAQHWIGGWIGILLSLLFIQLLSMAIVLIGQTVGERAFTRVRRFFVVVVVLAISAIVLPRDRASLPHNAEEIVNRLQHSFGGRILLAPFEVFARILTADPLIPDVIKFGGIGISMILLLLLIVMRLDAHYLEAAARSGQQVYDRLQRFRRGGGVSLRATSAKFRIPMLPRLGGAGAVAWRQLLTALRTAKALLAVMTIICIAIGPIFYFSGMHEKAEYVLVGIMFWITFTLSNLLRFDFRGDLDQIDTLKSLPARASAIAVAQLIAPTAMLILFQMVLLLSMLIGMHSDPRIIGIVMLFAIPLDALLIAVENLIFLIFPFRTIAVSPGDLQGVGRQMLVFLLKAIVLIATATLAGGIGVAVWWIADKSLIALLIASLLTLILELIGMIPLLVIAYRKFDPSVDTPA